MKIYTLSKLRIDEIEKLCQRARTNSDGLRKDVQKILHQVKTERDEAVFRLTKEIDGIKLSSLRVSSEEIEQAEKKISPEIKEALQIAKKNIETFHKQFLWTRSAEVETTKGVICFSETRAIEKVGLYIPGGTAPLLSTVLMLGVPSQIAGCSKIVLCTPPRKNNSKENSKEIICPEILYAASLCGIMDVYSVGGAHAIAAMGYGTQSIPKVYKIFGPGNQYVTMAKQLISMDEDGAAIDLPAGPTEQMILADETSNPTFVAFDLLSQLEHGADSQVVLVTSTEVIAERIKSEMDSYTQSLSRKEIIKQSIRNSFIIVAPSRKDMLSFANLYAPEHLLLQVNNPEEFIPHIKNAGSVFIGNYSSESAGDYASGTNHTLPTYGYARAYSGVSVASFQKTITFQKLTKEGAQNIAKVVTTLAAFEGLDAHKTAMEVRVKES